MPAPLIIDVDKCTGCRMCEIICSLRHHGAIWPERSGIRILESDARVLKILCCKQCSKPSCALACSTGALKSADETVVVNEALCNGCGACVEACPFNAIFVDKKSRLAVKCDLCMGDPACVKICLDKAISSHIPKSKDETGKSKCHKSSKGSQ